MMAFNPTVPAKAGTQAELAISRGAETCKAAWIPAFAGMLGGGGL